MTPWLDWRPLGFGIWDLGLRTFSVSDQLLLALHGDEGFSINSASGVRGKHPSDSRQ